MEGTKPGQLSRVLSIAYSDSRADFREVSTDQRFLYSRFGWWGPTNPNKPNVAKHFIINGITAKSAKQTQPTYHIYYQLLTAILAPVSRNLDGSDVVHYHEFRRTGSGSRVGVSRSTRSESGVPGGFCHRTTCPPTSSASLALI